MVDFIDTSRNTDGEEKGEFMVELWRYRTLYPFLQKGEKKKTRGDHRMARPLKNGTSPNQLPRKAVIFRRILENYRNENGGGRTMRRTGRGKEIIQFSSVLFNERAGDGVVG